METTDFDRKEDIVKWLVQKADILPSRADVYATQIISSGLGTMGRVSKKLAKTPTYLVDIGINEDDAEEIIDALKSESQMISSTSTTLSPSRSVESMSELSIQSDNVNDKYGRNSITLSVDDIDANVAEDARASEDPFACLEFESTSSTSGDQKQSQPPSQQQQKQSQDNTKIATSSENVNYVPRKERINNTSTIPPQSMRPATLTATGPMSANSKRTTTTMHEQFNIMRRTGNDAIAKIGNVMIDKTEIRNIYSNIYIELKSLLESNSGGSNPDAVSRILIRIYDIKQVDENITFIYQKSIGKEHILELLVKCLEMYVHSSIDVCLHALKAVCFAVRHGSSKHTIDYINVTTLKKSNICPILCTVFQYYLPSNHTEIISDQQWLLLKWINKLIGKLASIQETNKAFYRAGLSPLILRLLTYPFLPLDVDMEIIWVIWNMARYETFTVELVTNDITNILKQKLITYKSMNNTPAIQANHEIILCGILRCIVGITVSSVIAAEQFGTNGIISELITLFDTVSRYISVLEWTPIALASLTHFDGNVSILISFKICDKFIEKLRQYNTTEIVCSGICHGIQKLSEKDILSEQFGVSGICEILPGIMKTFIDSSIFMQVCCSTIGTLVNDNESNRDRLTQSGACENIIQVLLKNSITSVTSNQHNDSMQEGAVWQAAWCLRKISFGGKNRKRLTDGGVAEALVQALTRHVLMSDVVIQLLKTVKSLLPENVDALFSKMGSVGMCKAVTRCILKNINNVVINRLGADVLCHLAEYDANISIMVQAKALEAVTSILMNHSGGDKDCAKLGCQLLHRLCTVEGNTVKAKNVGAVEAVVWALQRQGEDKEVAEWGTLACYDLASENSTRAMLGSTGGCEVVIQTLAMHSDNPVIAFRGSSVMHLLSLDPQNKSWLGANGGCETLLKALKLHDSAQSVAADGILAIGSLAENHQGNNDRLRVGGACELVVKTMKRHDANPNVVDNACYAIHSLAERKDSIDRLGKAGACELVVVALSAHRDCISLIIHAFQACCRLGESNESNYIKCLSSGLIANTLRVLQNPKNIVNPTLCYEGFMTAAYISKKKDNRISAGNSNICKVVYDLFVKHHALVDIAIGASKAIESLCIDCDENRDRFIQLNSCELLLTCLTIHKDSEKCCGLLFRALLILSKSQDAKQRISTVESFKVIVKILGKLKPTDKSLSDVMYTGIELLTSLSYSPQIAMMLGHTSGCCKMLSSQLLQFKDVVEVIMAGMNLVTALCSAPGSVNKSKCRNNEFCELFGYVFNKYPNNMGVIGISLKALIAVLGGDSPASRSGADGGGDSSSHGQLTHPPPSTDLNSVAMDMGSSAANNSTSSFNKLKNAFSRGGKTLQWGSATTGSSATKDYTTPSTGAAGLLDMFAPLKEEKGGDSAGGNTVPRSTSSVATSGASKSNVFSTMSLNNTVNSMLSTRDTLNSTLNELSLPQMLQKLGTIGLCRTLMKIVGIYNDDQDIAMLLFEVLYILSQEDTLASAFVKLDICSVILPIIRNYITKNEGCARTVAMLIGTYAKTQNIMLGTLGVCEIITMTMTMFVDKEQIVDSCSYAIYHLANNNQYNKNAFGRANVIDSLYTSLQTYGLSAVTCYRIIKAMIALQTDNIENIIKFCNKVSPQVLIYTMTSNSHEYRIVYNLLWIINNICSNYDNTYIPVRYFQSIAVQLEKYKTNEDIVCIGCSVIASLIGSAGNVESTYCNFILAVITRYPSSNKVLLEALRAMSSLMSAEKSVYGTGYSMQGRQIVIASDEKASVENTVAPSPVSGGRAALPDAGTRENVEYFSNNNNIEFIMKMLSKHSDDISISTWVISCIAYLLKYVNSTNAEDYLNKFTQPNIIKLYSKIFSNVNQNDILAYKVCVLITEICRKNDESMMKMQSAGFNVTVMDCMREHLNNPYVIKAGNEAIAALCRGTETGRTKMGGVGACEAVCNGLNTHRNIPLVAISAFQAIAALTSKHAENKQKCGLVGACRLVTEEICTGAFVSANGVSTVESMSVARWGCLAAGNLVEDSLIAGASGAVTTGAVASPADSESRTSRKSASSIMEQVAGSRLSAGKNAFMPSGGSISTSQHNGQSSGVILTNNAMRLWDAGFCEPLVVIVQKYETNEAIMQNACWAIYALTHSDPNACYTLKSLGVSECLTNVAQKFPNNKLIAGWSDGAQQKLAVATQPQSTSAMKSSASSW